MLGKLNCGVNDTSCHTEQKMERLFRFEEEIMALRVRRDVKLLVLGVAYFSVFAGFFAGLAGSTEGWSGGVLYVVFVAGPLFVIGYALRSPSTGVERTTAVVSLALALYWFAVIGGNWGEYSLIEKVLVPVAMAPAISAFLAAFAVELPSFKPRILPPGNR